MTIQFSSVQFSRSVVSDSLWPHESQHPRPPCPSATTEVHSDSCLSSQWCHPTISSSVVPFSSCPQSPPSIRVFSNESTLRMGWPKYWSFSFSIIPSKEIPGLISFRMDWFQWESNQVFSNTRKCWIPVLKAVGAISFSCRTRALFFKQHWELIQLSGI